MGYKTSFHFFLTIFYDTFFLATYFDFKQNLKAMPNSGRKLQHKFYENPLTGSQVVA
jgi:hypothetical protein